MAKSIRSKAKRKNRTEFRNTIGSVSKQLFSRRRGLLFFAIDIVSRYIVWCITDLQTIEMLLPCSVDLSIICDEWYFKSAMMTTFPINVCSNRREQ